MSDVYYGYRLQVERERGSVSSHLRNEINYYYYFAGSDFAFIEGWRSKTRVEFTNRLTSGRLKAGYELEVNDRGDFESDDLFSSYSPRRHHLGLRQMARSGHIRSLTSSEDGHNHRQGQYAQRAAKQKRFRCRQAIKMIWLHKLPHSQRRRLYRLFCLSS